MDTVSERVSLAECLSSPYFLPDRRRRGFAWLRFFLRVASKVNARHYRNLCTTEIGGNINIQLPSFPPQSQIMGVGCECVALEIQTALFFYYCSHLLSEELVFNLNVYQLYSHLFGKETTKQPSFCLSE